MNAAPVAPAVFEFLDKTHQDIMAQLVLLSPLVDAIESEGLNAANREKVRRILHYFNTEARQHHLDEEKHIFPFAWVERESICISTRYFFHIDRETTNHLVRIDILYGICQNMRACGQGAA